MNIAIPNGRSRSGRIPAELLLSDREHGRGCLCVCCWTRRHAIECACYWCGQRRGVEDEYVRALERVEREPVSSDRAAEHVARLKLTRRELAAELGVSLGTAQRVATPGGQIPRRLERCALALMGELPEPDENDELTIY